MRTYSNVLSELKAASINPLFGEFYKYEDFPLEEEFGKFFELAQGHVDRHDSATATNTTTSNGIPEIL